MMSPIKPYLTRPFLPDARQLWLSPPLVLLGAPQLFVRPLMPWDEFLPAVYFCFAFVFAFNAVLDVKRMPSFLRGLSTIWFVFLLFLVPCMLWMVFNDALWALAHPMPDGGYGAR